MHYFLTNAEGTAQIVAKYTKVEDREVNSHAIYVRVDSYGKNSPGRSQRASSPISQLIGKTAPQAPFGQAGEFDDPRFFTELRDSGFLKKLWGDKL